MTNLLDHEYAKRLADDQAIAEEMYNLSKMMRRSFVNQYQDKELVFALSLESARIDTCVKDIERGRVPNWLSIVKSAIGFKVITLEMARLRLGRFGNIE